MSGTQLSLFDWSRGDSAFEELSENQKKPFAVTTSVDQMPGEPGVTAIRHRIARNSQFSRHVWIEADKGVIKVHCYDGTHDEPTTVFLDTHCTYVRVPGNPERLFEIEHGAYAPLAQRESTFTPESRNP